MSWESSVANLNFAVVPEKIWNDQPKMPSLAAVASSSQEHQLNHQQKFPGMPNNTHFCVDGFSKNWQGQVTQDQLSK